MGMVAGATTENGAAWPAAAALVSMRCFARRSIGDAKHSSAGGGEEEKRKSAYFGNSFSGNHDTCMIGPAVVLTAIEQTAAVAQSEFEITSCPAALAGSLAVSIIIPSPRQEPRVRRINSINRNRQYFCASYACIVLMCIVLMSIVCRYRAYASMMERSMV